MLAVQTLFGAIHWVGVVAVPTTAQVPLLVLVQCDSTALNKIVSHLICSKLDLCCHAVD